MAIIYSNRNATGSHVTINANSTSAWSGGVVPNGADQVYIVSRRTQINQSNFSKWTGTRTITVDSTANFASSGFFYTVTDRGEIAKVSYTGTTSTTFTGCSLDETDSFFRWIDGGSIYNDAYVINPSNIIEIPQGETFECNELIIQEGGYLFINGGTLKINQGILMRDGFLIGEGSGQIIISRPAGSTSSSTVGYLTAENYQLSVIKIDGGENRAYGYLTSASNPGATSVEVNMESGSFARGDEIAIYVENDYRRRNVGYSGYRDASASFKDMDEGFDVAGVSGNTVYLATRNGTRGTVKSYEVDGDNVILNVFPDNTYFMAGDKIVLNNEEYTIESVEDSEFLVKNYDFTNPETSLSDFWVDDTTHAYSNGWVIQNGVGLRNTDTGQYRELVYKNLWERNVIIEAHISPLDSFYTGSRGSQGFGLLSSYDPSFRSGHRSYDSFKTDYFRVDDGQDYISFDIRSVSNYVSNRLSRETSFRDSMRIPAWYRVENRKGFSIASVNGKEFTKEFRRDGGYKGLVGLFVSGNQNFRCRELNIKLPTQRIRIQSSASFSPEDRVFQSGSLNNHPSGSKVVKIASINTGNGSHHDLAFAYLGQNGSGEFPIIIQVNGVNTSNSSLPYIHNHDMNVDYFYDLGTTTSQRSVTVDLNSQKTFTHVSFVPRFNDNSGNNGMNGVAIYGSNDLSNWTTLYGPTNDTKRWNNYSFNRMAFYPTGTVSYRYVKFETAGRQSSINTNRYVNIGVHNFSEGYTLDLNNASDFNIGDTITVLPDSGYNWGSRELEGYDAFINAAGQDPETYWHGGWLMECSIINKIGNKIYLDRPIFWGYIEDRDSVTVVKTNKNFKITGTIENYSGFTSWRFPQITTNSGTSLGKKYLFKNILFKYIGSARYSGLGDFTRGFRLYSSDYWNAAEVDGCVFHMGPDGATWNGVYSYAAHDIFRNNVIISQRNFFSIYNTSNAGTAFFNNKILGVISTTINSTENFAFNYNEVATCDYGVEITGIRGEPYSIPFASEVVRNTIKGTSNFGMSFYDESRAAIPNPRIKILGNKIRATDDSAINGGFSSISKIKDLDVFAEHTGSRLSRYRNESFISHGDATSLLSPNLQLENYGRFGYDLVNILYAGIVRDHRYPDVLEVFNYNGDDFLPKMGMEIDVIDNVPFKVYVRFEYKYSQRARLQDDGNLDGRIGVSAIQDATIRQTLYGAVPSSAGEGWNVFEGTLDQFSSTEGKAAVYMYWDSINSYIKIRNSSAYILTNNADKIRVLANTFKITNIWDPYKTSQDIRSLDLLSNNVYKIKGVKF